MHKSNIPNKMKKSLILLLFTITLLGCAEDDSVQIPPSDLTTLPENVRSESSARQIATEALSLFYDSKSRGTHTLKEKAPYKLRAHSKGRSENEYPLIYAYDLEDNEGFILVSGLTNTPPILAATHGGNFDSPEVLANYAFQTYLDGTLEGLSQNSSIINPPPINRDTVTDFLRNDTEILSDETINPLVEVHWDQSWPYNMYCQNHIAGCVPIAISQMMTYFEYPKQFYYGFPGKDIASETINWAELRKHYHELVSYKNNPSDFFISLHLSVCSASLNAHKTIGRIVRQVGYLCNAEYKDSATSVNSDIPKVALPNIFGSSKFSMPNSMDTRYSLIKSGGLLLVYGQKPGVGHAWVADGYKFYHEKVSTNRIRWGMIVETVKVEENKYYTVHYNWGNGGSADGWYADGPSARPENYYSLQFYGVAK